MQSHPYRPANRRGYAARVRNNDTLWLEHRDRGPCLYAEGGRQCGRRERQRIHQQPFGHKYETKKREVAQSKGIGKDAPVY
jgi:hypothetical protein